MSVSSVSNPKGARLPISIMLSMGFVALMVVLAIFADVIALYDTAQMDLLNRFAPPIFMGGSWAHPLGTDNLGRDMLSLVLRGIQISMTIATLGTLGGAVIGSALGFAAAWFGGWVDALVGVAVDFQAALPFLVLALALLAALPHANMGLFILIMCIYGWERYARLARAISLSAMEQPYVQAQRVLGASGWRIATRSILPNAMAVLLVNLSLNFPATVLAETSLSFLGIGIQPPDTSLGALIGQGRNQLYNAPWMALTPGLLILLATVSISILGDWARDLVERD
jgi:peptide/nickel transport system permease protein